MDAPELEMMRLNFG